MVSHIFFLHSNITIYLANYYIKKNIYPEHNIIIFYDRVKKSDVSFMPGKKISYAEMFPNFDLNKNNFWATYRCIRRFLEKEVAEDYILYVPHILFDTLQIFAFYKKCKKIIYIEEGDLSYLEKSHLDNRFPDLPFWDSLKRKIFSLGILKSKHPFAKTNRSEELICLHEEAFPFKKLFRNIYNINEVFKLDSKDSFKKDYNDSLLFLIDPLHLKSNSEIECYYECLKKVFLFIKLKLRKKIYFKPHPVVLTHFKDQIKVFCSIADEIGLENEIIGDPVELILVNFRNVRVVTHFSSLIRYSFYANVEVFFWGFELISHKELIEGSSRIEYLENNKSLVHWIDRPI